MVQKDGLTSRWQTLGVLFRSHPWHGVPIGPLAPEVVTVYVEIVPTDTVKYELDKVTASCASIDRRSTPTSAPRSTD